MLGIKASDNLTNANYALMVEGEEDKRTLTAILSSLSSKISRALKNNLLVVYPIGGSGNLSYKLSLIKDSLCIPHTFLDNDEAGRNARNKAEQEGLLTTKDTTMAICNGMKESELEDVIDCQLYASAFLEKFGVSLNVKQFKGREKWSNRVRATFLSQGKHWDDYIQKLAKDLVVKCVEQKPKQSLNTHKRGSVDSLVQSLENLIKIK